MSGRCKQVTSAPFPTQLNNWKVWVVRSPLFIGSPRGGTRVGGWAGQLSAVDSDRWESPSRSIDWIRQKPRNQVAANNATRSDLRQHGRRLHWPSSYKLRLKPLLHHSYLHYLYSSLLQHTRRPVTATSSWFAQQHRAESFLRSWHFPS